MRGDKVVNLPKAIIISGFPGIGKTYYVEKYGGHDSDSSQFSWIRPGERHPDWPQNYIEHIQKLNGVILVSSHKEVRDALAASHMSFWLCFPRVACRDEYLERYRCRGSSEAFLTLLERNWDDWIDEMYMEKRCDRRMVLANGEFLSNLLPGEMKW